MNLSFKRIVAFLIDGLILFVLLTMLSSTVIKSTEDQILSQELMKEAKVLLENPECKECIKNIENISYKLSKANMLNEIAGISLYIIYFVVLPPFTNGQTIGKKLMKIKIISKTEKKLSIIQTLIRTTVLYGLATNAITLIVLIGLSKAKYLSISNVLTYLQFFMFFLCFVGLFRKEGVSFHDLLSKTKVVADEGQSSVMVDHWESAQTKRKHTKKEEGKKDNE